MLTSQSWYPNNEGVQLSDLDSRVDTFILSLFHFADPYPSRFSDLAASMLFGSSLKREIKTLRAAGKRFRISLNLDAQLNHYSEAKLLSLLLWLSEFIARENLDGLDVRIDSPASLDSRPIQRLLKAVHDALLAEMAFSLSIRYGHSAPSHFFETALPMVSEIILLDFPLISVHSPEVMAKLREIFALSSARLVISPHPSKLRFESLVLIYFVEVLSQALPECGLFLSELSEKLPHHIAVGFKSALSPNEFPLPVSYLMALNRLLVDAGVALHNS